MSAPNNNEAPNNNGTPNNNEAPNEEDNEEAAAEQKRLRKNEMQRIRYHKKKAEKAAKEAEKAAEEAENVAKESAKRNSGKARTQRWRENRAGNAGTDDVGEDRISRGFQRSPQAARRNGFTYPSPSSNVARRSSTSNPPSHALNAPPRTPSVQGRERTPSTSRSMCGAGEDIGEEEEYKPVSTPSGGYPLDRALYLPSPRTPRTRRIPSTPLTRRQIELLGQASARKSERKKLAMTSISEISSTEERMFNSAMEESRYNKEHIRSLWEEGDQDDDDFMELIYSLADDEDDDAIEDEKKEDESAATPTASSKKRTAKKHHSKKRTAKKHHRDESDDESYNSDMDKKPAAVAAGNPPFGGASFGSSFGTSQVAAGNPSFGAVAPFGGSFGTNQVAAGNPSFGAVAPFGGSFGTNQVAGKNSQGSTFQSGTGCRGFNFTAASLQSSDGLMVAVTGGRATGNHDVSHGQWEGLNTTVAALAEQYPASSGWMLNLFGIMRDNGKIILHCVASKQTLVEVIAISRLLGDGGIESFYSFNDYNLEWGRTEYFEVPNNVYVLRFRDNCPPADQKLQNAFEDAHLFQFGSSPTWLFGPQLNETGEEYPIAIGYIPGIYYPDPEDPTDNFGDGESFDGSKLKQNGVLNEKYLSRLVDHFIDSCELDSDSREAVKQAYLDALATREATMAEAQRLVGSYPRGVMLEHEVIHIYPDGFQAPDDGNKAVTPAQRTANYQQGGLGQHAYYPKAKGYMICGLRDFIEKRSTPASSLFGGADTWSQANAQAYDAAAGINGYREDARLAREASGKGNAST